MQAIKASHLALYHAVIADVVHGVGRAVGPADILVAGEQEAAGIEEIGVSFDLTHFLGCRQTSPDITDAALGILCPHALCQSIIRIEGINIAFDPHIGAAYSKVVLTEIVVVIAYQDPTGDQLAKSGIAQAILRLDHAGELGLALADTCFAQIVVEAVNDLQAGKHHAIGIVAVAYPAGSSQAINIHLAVELAVEHFTAAALQRAVRNGIAMAGSRQGSTPIHNRIAAGMVTFRLGCYMGLIVTDTADTEGTAGIAGLSTGGSLVLRCGNLVDVIAVGCIDHRGNICIVLLATVEV